MRISVDGRRIRNNKVAFSNLSGIVWRKVFSRKMSKVISTSHTDDAFVLSENEVCATCRHFQY